MKLYYDNDWKFYTTEENMKESYKTYLHEFHEETEEGDNIEPDNYEQWLFGLVGEGWMLELDNCPKINGVDLFTLYYNIDTGKTTTIKELLNDYSSITDNKPTFATWMDSIENLYGIEGFELDGYSINITMHGKTPTPLTLEDVIKIIPERSSLEVERVCDTYYHEPIAVYSDKNSVPGHLRTCPVSAVSVYDSCYSVIIKEDENTNRRSALLSSIELSVEISESKLPLNEIIEQVQRSYPEFRFNRTEMRYQSCIVAVFEKR